MSVLTVTALIAATLVSILIGLGVELIKWMSIRIEEFKLRFNHVLEQQQAQTASAYSAPANNTDSDPNRRNSNQNTGSSTKFNYDGGNFKNSERNAATPSSGSFIELSHGRIHYRLLGNPLGHLVVFFSPETVYSYFWFTTARQLIAEGYQVLLFDWFATGESDSPSIDLNNDDSARHGFGSLNFHLDTAIELTEKLHFSKPFTLCGCGTGAQVALAFAAECPERISKLILLNPGGFRPSIFNFGAFALWALTKLSRFSIAERIVISLAQVVQFMSIAAPYLRAYLKFYTANIQWNFIQTGISLIDNWLLAWSTYLHHLTSQLRNNRYFVEHSLAMLQNFPVYEKLSDDVYERVRIHPKKILLLWGSGNSVHPFRFHKRYQRMLPQIQFQKIRGGSHLMLLDHAQDVSDAITGFIWSHASNMALNTPTRSKRSVPTSLV